MGRVVVSENISLDGVMQDPTGEGGLQFGGWWTQIGDRDREARATVTLDEVRAATAWLLGRRTYEFFAARWPSRSGELADRFNAGPKYIVSSTLEHPRWNNSTVLKGDVVAEVSKLKQSLGGDTIVLGSRQLVHSLVEHDLVDELRILLHPYVLGAGDRLFEETQEKRTLRLVSSRTVGDNLALLSYQFVRKD
ncbi:MAG TPA: dihydrofolate reductase family protein [Thermoplasmata archaeon]|nr:dihydrofolate reductase family protein [Thermoplasmata archaeon]